MNLWQLFESTAARCPDRAAVEMQHADRVERWTYRELHAAAIARAAWLVAICVGAGERCAILADNAPEWCAAYFGVLGAGGVAVPIDTDLSPAQLAAIVDDASPRVLFVNDRLEAVAREVLEGRTDVVLCNLSALVPLSIFIPPSTPSTLSSAAVILYTSGTTGDPKGVLLSHGNLIAERDGVLAVADVSESDRVLGVMPLFHAWGQLANVLLPLLVGARVVFLDAVVSTDLVRALSGHRITIFACGPRVVDLIHQRAMSEVAGPGLLKRSMVAAALALSFRLRRVGVNVGPTLFRKSHNAVGPQVRWFIVGGSKFDPGIGRDLYALGFTILQAYGLAETAGAATITSPADAPLDSVGRALPGHELKVMPGTDGELNGEIAIAGPIVMQGYFNRADATTNVMLGDWFLTGDLGRLDAHGRLTIAGRKTEVVVLASGQNVYPEEIEAHYCKSQFVKEMCVLRSAGASTERLLAVVVPDMDVMRARRIVNVGDLIRFEMESLAIGLPLHKRVFRYELSFEPLPRTTMGRLKRHEIVQRLQQKSRDATRAAIHPATISFQWREDPDAIAAVAIIAARAKGAVVLPDSNLELDLGLDSMERVGLLTALEQRFGVRVPEDRSHHILTVEQLVAAVRPGPAAVPGFAPQDSWEVLL
nr:AMP-binding protein [Acidobacteriota bacterium]